MQLETGKSKHGLLGSFRTIIREEGYVELSHVTRPPMSQSFFGFFPVAVSGDCTEVSFSRFASRYMVIEPLARTRPPTVTRGTQTCDKIVSTGSSHFPIAWKSKTANSAANDFWGKTYMQLTGQTKMNQELAILTGSSAGATESFVVVPFELVKIKCADLCVNRFRLADLVHHHSKTSGQVKYICRSNGCRQADHQERRYPRLV